MNSYHIRGTAKYTSLKNESYNSYSKDSKERESLLNACSKLRNKKNIKIPCIVNGERIYDSSDTVTITMPSNNSIPMFTVHLASEKLIKSAIKGALEAKRKWELLPLDQRCSVLFKAADLLTKEYRDELNSVIMLVQGKTMWQAEIDLVEMIDFWRFNAKYALDIYERQPKKNFAGSWNKVEYRPLEGFISVISPFNFASIMGNLNTTPVLLGNVTLWKPGTSTALSSLKLYEILEKAGLPAGVIQFLPSKGKEFANVCFNSKDFAGLHFTGSTKTFTTIWKQISQNIDTFRTFPRLVGETGGKNFHVLHKSANLENFLNCSIRGAFEYSGQKCSATSRLYIPKDIWNDKLKKLFIEKTKELNVGQPDDPKSFTSCVIDEKSYNKIVGYIERNKKNVIVGGNYSKKDGWFVYPTIIETNDPKSETMVDEIFGPVLTVYPYEGEWEEVLKLVDSTSQYALTGSVFANDRYAIAKGMEILRNASGNFYINDKSTGAVVGQQPFGGARKSGTNDKAGADVNLMKWVSMRSIKETMLPLKSPYYPSTDL